MLSAVTRDFPFSENFDSTENLPGHTMPEGWTFEDTNGDNVAWDLLTPVDPSYAHSQPNSMHMAFGFSQAMNDWGFTPALYFNSSDSYQLSFWVRCGLDMFTGEAAPEKLRVSVGDANNSESMTIELYVDDLVDNMDFQQVILEINVPESGEYFIGFQSFSDPGGFILAIDDVEIEEFASNDDSVISPINLRNYPNPFNPQTTIHYELTGNSSSEIEIFNSKGQKMDSIPVNYSENQVVWNADSQSSGVYFYRLKGNISSTAKMVLMK